MADEQEGSGSSVDGTEPRLALGSRSVAAANGSSAGGAESGLAPESRSVVRYLADSRCGLLWLTRAGGPREEDAEKENQANRGTPLLPVPEPSFAAHVENRGRTLR